jgi:hypothetical protein
MKKFKLCISLCWCILYFVVEVYFCYTVRSVIKVKIINLYFDVIDSDVSNTIKVLFSNYNFTPYTRVGINLMHLPLFKFTLVLILLLCGNCWCPRPCSVKQTSKNINCIQYAQTHAPVFLSSLCNFWCDCSYWNFTVHLNDSYVALPCLLFVSVFVLFPFFSCVHFISGLAE